MSVPRVLIIAGSDSGGGAGIQGDIKTVSAFGCYAATAITALTAQNTRGVFGIHEVPAEFVAKQIELVLSDIGADSIKIGMLHRAEIIEKIAEILAKYPEIPLILDTVMFAKGGAPLLEASAIVALKEKLLPRALIITPNIPEAEYLAGIKINSVDDMKIAARKLLDSGCKSVLLKGGHADDDIVSDIFLENDENGKNLQEIILTSKRVNTVHTHGTGCAYASAIASLISRKIPLNQAVQEAHDYVAEAIKHAPNLGTGHGPIGHNYKLTEL